MTIEEEIWDYIDGNCTAAQTLVIEARIGSDPAYSALYKEFMDIHQQMAEIDLEEPSMSFTRNVMEQVELEIAPVALKTKVDKRIIYSIAAFFALSIIGVFGYALANSNFSFSTIDYHFNFQMESVDFGKYVTPTFIKVFLFVDVLLGLVYLDSLLRRRKA